MSDRHREKHPEELLSDYQDGTLEPRARRKVEEHLATCAVCRQDVAAAGSAVVALSRLPEVEPPGLADGPLSWLEPVGAAQEPILGGARRFRLHWQRSSAGRPRPGWLVATAAVLAVAALVLIPLALSGHRQAQTEPGRTAAGAGGPAVPKAALPPVIDTGAAYGSATIQALAHALADAAVASPGDRFLAPAGPASNAGAPLQPAADPEQASRCLIQGAGLGPGDSAVYLEVATYEGAPAYVGGFVTSGAKPALLLIVVARSDCRFLFEARQSI